MLPDPPTSPQDLLMLAVCLLDEAAAIAGIDAALSAGANFTAEGVTPLWYAAFGGNTAVLEHLFRLGHTLAAEWPHREGAIDERHGNTPLHAAAMWKHVNACRVLLAQPHSKRLLDTFDELGDTPLHCAVRANHLDIARALLAAGADVNANDQTRIGFTPLDHAVFNNSAELVRLLLGCGADPDLDTWMGMTPRDRAEQPEIIALFQPIPVGCRSTRRD